MFCCLFLLLLIIIIIVLVEVWCGSVYTKSALKGDSEGLLRLELSACAVHRVAVGGHIYDRSYHVSRKARDTEGCWRQGRHYYYGVMEEQLFVNLIIFIYTQVFISVDEKEGVFGRYQ